MKRTRLNKKSKTPEARLKSELMDLVKKHIKKRDGNICFSCGITGLMGSNWHAGHFIRDSVGGVALRYNLTNIHSQCARCNIFLSGNEGEYYIKMVDKYGQEFVDELFRIKHQEQAKWSKQDYQDKINYYKELNEGTS